MHREANGGPLAHVDPEKIHIQTPALQNKPTPHPSPPMHRPHHVRTPEATSSAIGLSPLTRFLHHSPESYLHSLSCDKLVMFRICISIHRSFVYQRMIISFSELSSIICSFPLKQCRIIQPIRSQKPIRL